MRNSENKRVMELLNQAMNAAQGSHLLETRKGIQLAMTKLEDADKSFRHKQAQSQTEAQKWWKNVVSGVANAPASKTAANMSLDQLNKMIQIEEKAIDDIETSIQTSIQAKNAGILND